MERTIIRHVERKPILVTVTPKLDTGDGRLSKHKSYDGEITTGKTVSHSGSFLRILVYKDNAGRRMTFDHSIFDIKIKSTTST